MESLVKKFEIKLIDAGLANTDYPHQPLIAGLDDRLFWNRKSDQASFFESIFSRLNISALISLRPSEPYASIIGYLSDQALKGKSFIDTLCALPPIKKIF